MDTLFSQERLELLHQWMDLKRWALLRPYQHNSIVSQEWTPFLRRERLELLCQLMDLKRWAKRSSRSPCSSWKFCLCFPMWACCWAWILSIWATHLSMLALSWRHPVRNFTRIGHSFLQHRVLICMELCQTLLLVQAPSMLCVLC